MLEEVMKDYSSEPVSRDDYKKQLLNNYTLIQVYFESTTDLDIV